MSTDGGQPLLQVSHLVKHFPGSRRAPGRRRDVVHAVQDVSLSVWPGETVGIVGESGCGKSTTARMMIRLIDPTAGQIEFKGQDITRLSARAMRPLRRDMQLIFQNPYSCLNPRKTVGQSIASPMKIHGIGGDLHARVGELLERVGLSPDFAGRFPHEFSGGQRQRVGIARALSLRPSLIVCDEPVSALDVSIQAQILALLGSLQEDLGVAYVFISHDLAVIRQICDRVAVMYAGRIVEMGDVETIFSQPRHPYTLELLAAVPGPRRRHRAGAQTEDSEPAGSTTGGCLYRDRCPRRQERCVAEAPELAPSADGSESSLVACHFPVERGNAGNGSD